ncbi:hypothetical protein PoMZ_09705, partial [Pyricularia oryzae]
MPKTLAKSYNQSEIFLHFQTKLASPLLPLISFVSFRDEDVHCTLKVYQNGLASVSSGRRFVTLMARHWHCQWRFLFKRRGEGKRRSPNS